MNADELRAQRKMIARHLAWLDEQIALAESGPHDKRVASPTEPVDEESVGPDLEPYGREYSSGLSISQRMGCIMILTLVALLFLASLFILPSFLYE